MALEALSRVVSIGGGTGLSCLLKGLKNHVYDPPVIEAPPFAPWISRLTAVVTVTDDGGSSGRLRDELQVLPPGDIRNCLVAMSTDESLLSELFQYRFHGGGDLDGHSFGNLFLTALTSVTGDFLKAIRVSSDVLSIRGRIFPATLHDVHLEATLEDGRKVVGETAISKSRKQIRKISLNPRNVRPVPDALAEIRNADVITLGPGSLFTSLIPNLLVRGVVDAIRESHAVKVYVGNLMTQPGETDGMTLSEHLDAIHRHTRCRLFEIAVLNSRRISRASLMRYRAEGAEPVAADLDRVRATGIKVFESDLLARGSVIRHDPAKLGAAVRLACRQLRTSKPRQSGQPRTK